MRWLSIAATVIAAVVAENDYHLANQQNNQLDWDYNSYTFPARHESQKWYLGLNKNRRQEIIARITEPPSLLFISLAGVS